MSLRCLMDLTTDCHTYDATCVKREGRVGLGVKHDAAIAAVGGMRDLETPILPHGVDEKFVREGEMPTGSWIQMFLSDPEIENLLSLKR